MGDVPVHILEQLAAQHVLHELVVAEAAGGRGDYSPAVSQDGHPVGDGEHLVEVMRDEDDGHAARRDAAQRIEQPGALRAGH